NPGGAASLQVSVLSSSGFNQPVALSVPDLPSGVNANFTPSSITPNGVSLLTLSASQSATAINQGITIRGTAGAVHHDPTGTIDVQLGLVPQCFTAMNVHVVDDETDAPLAGVSVNFVTQTDANGDAQLTNIGLDPGNGPKNIFMQIVDTGYFNFDAFQLVGC